jgi:hypothetical protein
VIGSRARERATCYVRVLRYWFREHGRFLDVTRCAGNMHDVVFGRRDRVACYLGMDVVTGGFHTLVVPFGMHVQRWIGWMMWIYGKSWAQAFV